MRLDDSTPLPMPVVNATTPITDFPVGRHSVGTGQPALVIGEVAQAHDGSLGLAHAYIDAIAGAGANAVKFQTHIAAAESTPAEPWRIAFSRQDASRYEYWQRMEFSAEQWHGLKRHAEELGLVFLSSPFSDEAVELLDKLGVAAWKVASGEVTNPLLLQKIADTGKPVLLSSGMSRFSDLDSAVALLGSRRIPVAVLQCTTAYPCPPEQVGLNLIATLRQRYQLPTGLSDHSGTIYPALAAATLGASVIEVHVTMSREMFGPDVSASVTTGELRQLVDGVRFIEQSMSHPIEKDDVADECAKLQTTFGKSLMLRADLPAGTELEPAHITAKKPGTGTPASRLHQVLGRRLTCDVPANVPLTDNMLMQQTFPARCAS